MLLFMPRVSIVDLIRFGKRLNSVFFHIKYQLMACHVLRNGILSFDMKSICDLVLIAMSIP